ncbi:MAG: hypothetical protein NUW01_00100 [Gemmatimonadaceae bacterium]|nr:hypothetical protein [Gemmatimonadaceae bacterium]
MSEQQITHYVGDVCEGGHREEPGMSEPKYKPIDQCSHVLHDLRGGCSGCNHDVESIIGDMEERARRHDAEDARRVKDFEADMLRRNLERDATNAALQQAREALGVAMGAITHESSTLMQRDLKRATENTISAALAAIDALGVRG